MRRSNWIICYHGLMFKLPFIQQHKRLVSIALLLIWVIYTALQLQRDIMNFSETWFVIGGVGDVYDGGTGFFSIYRLFAFVVFIDNVLLLVIINALIKRLHSRN